MRLSVSGDSVYARPLARGETPEGDKAGCGGFIEGAVGIVGSEVSIVEGVWSCASRYGAGSLVKLEADGARNGLLGLVYEGVEGGFQGGEPEAFVGELGVTLLD